MQKTIITTVGTSLIINYLNKSRKNNSPDTDCQEHYDTLKKYSFFEHDLDEKKITKVLESVSLIKTKLGSFSNCAEISSIEAITEQLCENLDKNLKLTLFFVCTDTILSPLCAEVIATYLSQKKKTFTVKNNKGVDITVEIEIATKDFVVSKDSVGHYKSIIENINNKDFDNNYIVKGLTANNNTDFQNTGFEGLSSIITNISLYSNSTKPDDIKEDEIKKNIKNTIANITGGYKGFIPVMTLICQLLEIEMQYLYEESKTLISIPKLPIQFDLAIIESIASHLKNDYLATISRNTYLYKLLEKYKFINDKTEMSGIGQILHNHLFNGQIGLSNSILGSFIELKLFHYFSTCNHTKYHSPVKNDEADYYAYKIDSGEYKFSEKQKDKPDDKKIKELGFAYKLGDIDLILKNEINQDTICEIKAHHTFSETYAGDLNKPKPKDYYDKIKARIEFWKHTRRTVPNEYLFIVYKIKILQGDESEFLTENTKNMIKHFSDKIKQDYQQDVAFKVLGLWVNLNKDFEINYSSLLQEDIKDGAWILNLEKN